MKLQNFKKTESCVNKLIKIYPNIKYIQSNLVNDSSLIFNYNLVGGRSTFI